MSFNNLRLNQYHKNFAKTGIVSIWGERHCIVQ